MSRIEPITVPHAHKCHCGNENIMMRRWYIAGVANRLHYRIYCPVCGIEQANEYATPVKALEDWNSNQFFEFVVCVYDDAEDALYGQAQINAAGLEGGMAMARRSASQMASREGISRVEITVNQEGKTVRTNKYWLRVSYTKKEFGEEKNTVMLKKQPERKES